MAVIQNIFKNIKIPLEMTEEILIFKWNNKPVQEKIIDLMEWNDRYGPEANLVQAAETILEMNYPNEYKRYASMQQKFHHKIGFFMESESEGVSDIIDWVNGIFDKFGGLQEGLLGGLVISPAFQGTTISLEYDNGVLARILNKGDGDDAEMIINALEITNIPKELTVKKDIIIRGVVTFKNAKKLKKDQTITAAVNEILFDENNVSKVQELQFLPNEYITLSGKDLNTSKLYQTLKDNGFSVPYFKLTPQLIQALDVYQEIIDMDLDAPMKGVRFEVENGKTITTLNEMIETENLSHYIHKTILI